MGNVVLATNWNKFEYYFFTKIKNKNSWNTKTNKTNQNKSKQNRYL